MPKYVVISNHPPNSCPSANKILREMGKTLSKDLPPMMEKHKVKPEVLLHLDPGHKVLWVVEAPSAEAVRDFLRFRAERVERLRVLHDQQFG